MNAMQVARFNGFWFLSLVVPALLMFPVGLFRNKWLTISVGIISIVVTYHLCNLSVRQKWEIRNQVAQTDEEKRYATADGANIVFTALFIGPFEAILYTAFWGFLGWKVTTVASWRGRNFSYILRFGFLLSFIHLFLTVGLYLLSCDYSCMDTGRVPTLYNKIPLTLSGVLMFPGRLLWAPWASWNLPQILEWSIFLMNSCLWGIGFAWLINLLKQKKDLTRQESDKAC